MRKIALPFTLLLVALNIHAQTRRIELRSSIGFLSDAHFVTALDKSTATFFGSFFSKEYKDFRIATSGVFSQELLITFDEPRLQLVTSYVYEQLKITDYLDNIPSTYNRFMNTALMGVHFNYVMKPKFSVYSGAEMGIRFNTYSGKTERINTRQFAYHITGGGIRYGEAVAGFTELGFGAKGWIRTGLAVSF
jgi:hypothetical protein